MFNCFVYKENKFLSINKYIWHLKMYHNLESQSFFSCKQQDYFRDFQGLEKFIQHLNRYHIIDNISTSLNDNIDTTFTDNSLVNKSDSFKFGQDVTYGNPLKHEEEINKMFKDIVSSNVLNCIANLYSKPNVTNALVQDRI